jgi:hypothetical protein
MKLKNIYIIKKRSRKLDPSPSRLAYKVYDLVVIPR